MKRHMTKTSANLSLEALEDRQLLSTTAFILFRTLHIRGDANNNSVLMKPDFSSVEVVTNRGESATFAQSAFDRVVVNLGEGSDTFRIVNDRSPAWDPDFRVLDMSIDLGGGDDTAFFFAGSPRNLQAMDLEIDLRTGAGVDQVFMHIPGMFEAKLDVDVDLGADGDFFHSFLRGRLFGSDALLNVRGSFGADEMSFEGGPSTLFATPHSTLIDDSSSLTVKLFGQRNADKIDMKLESVLGGRFDGRVQLLGHGGEGRDIITSNVDRNVNSLGDMFVDVVGAKGPDRLTLNLNTTTFGSPVVSPRFLVLPPIADLPDVIFIPPTVAGKIDGGDGFDFYKATLNVTVVNCEAVIGGPMDIFLPQGDDGVIAM